MTLYYIVYYMVYRTEYRKELMPIKYALFMLLKERAFSTANAQCGEIYLLLCKNKNPYSRKCDVKQVLDGIKVICEENKGWWKNAQYMCKCGMKKYMDFYFYSVCSPE